MICLFSGCFGIMPLDTSTFIPVSGASSFLERLRLKRSPQSNYRQFAPVAGPSGGAAARRAPAVAAGATQQECRTVNEQQCNTVNEQKCDTVNRQQCSSVNEQQCNTIQERQHC